MKSLQVIETLLQEVESKLKADREELDRVDANDAHVVELKQRLRDNLVREDQLKKLKQSLGG